jgi:two-component system, NtrC family, sensor histidine kinase KinB
MTARRFFGLRLRFLSAGVLLTLTTVATAAWTLYVLSSLASDAAATVRDADELTAATAAISSALEREDDALLVVLGGASWGHTLLSSARTVTDRAVRRLDAGSVAQQRSAFALRGMVSEYRQAVDSVVRVPGGQLLDRYYQDVNPLLREAVAGVAKSRDVRFEEARAATAKARDDVTRARNVVLLIAALAFGISAFVAHRLARHVLIPLRELADAAAAIRDGQFETRVRVGPSDEIGKVAEVFNEMTHKLGEFHRSNLGEILRAKRALEATMQALPDAVLLLDDQGRVAARNPRADQLFDELKVATPDTVEQLGKALGLHATAFGEALVRQQAFDRAALDVALRVGTNAGMRRLLPRIVPLSSGQEQSGSVLVLSDVTQLARLDEMRSELVALASHELRTPVTTLRMSLLMLREMSERLDRRVQELVRNALGGVDLLAETVDELLDMTRIEAGALMLNTEPVDMTDLAHEVVERNRERAEELGISLCVDAPGEAAVVVGDAARLRIVMDNLINNSLKYTLRGGAIRLSLRARHDAAASWLSVAVVDSGTGIPKELEARVFEKFFRVEHHRSDREEAPRGSGIGLYLCKEIVELHGGKIRCETPASKRGACFVFEMPMHQPQLLTSHYDANRLV